MPWSRVHTEYSTHTVQPTPSTSIHRVQHTPSTDGCLSSLHSHHHKLTPECGFSLRRASLHDRPPSASSPWELKGKVTLSHSHGCELTHWWIKSQYPVHRPSTASKSSSKLARLQTPSSLDHCLQLYLQTSSSTASELARTRPLSLSPNSLDYGLQSCLIPASKCISYLTELRSLQVHLQTPLITASTSASLNSPDHDLGVHL